MTMSRAFRLGVFIVVALLIFAAGVFWIGERHFLFSSTYRLSADFPNVAGLNGGAEVRVGGIHEGTVRQIQLPMRPNDKVHVVMELANGTRSVIKNDSVATIRSEGLVGDKFVEISFGSDQAPKVKNGDTIRGEPPLQLSDLLNKTSEVLDTTKGAIDNVNQTASNLNSITTKINQGQGSIGALINDKKIYQNVNAGTNAFKEDMEALKHNFFLRGFFKERGYESAADLKNDKTLKDAGDFLQSNRFGVVIVAAYTDMKGDSQQDRLLSEARAMVVRDYLVKNFKVEDTRIKTIGLGKSDKVADGGSVEILVYPEGTTTAQIPDSAPP